MLKHAFEKMKVTDLASYLAGGYCSTLLADLGANVIKLEPPTGDPFRMMSGAFQAWNRGKRSIAVDLRTDEGKEILHSLVGASDVAVENYRPGISQKLGADYETLRGINPALIYCSVSGYGQTGPYAQKPAFDPVLQARSGAMKHQGGAGNPPAHLAVPTSDYGAAMLGAYGIAMALYARVRTGRGQRVETSLLNATMCLQSGRFILSPERNDETAWIDSLGPSPTYRLYQTTDRWIFLGVTSEDTWRRLLRAIDREDLATDPRFSSANKRSQAASELIGILEEVFAADVSITWLDRLEAAGVPCAPANHLDDLFDHPQLLGNGLVVQHESPDLGPVKQIGVPIKLSRTPGIAQRPAPALGQHTNEILTEIGYSPEEIEALRDKKVAR